MPDPPTAARDAELEALRATVARLEAELAAQAASANAALADAQKRLFWLDELRIDLNELFARPLVAPVATTSLKVVRRLRRMSARSRRRRTR